MIMVEMVSIGANCFVLGLTCMRFLAMRGTRKQGTLNLRGSDGLPPMESLYPPVEEMKPLAEFPIAGKPRRVPWAVKRREIEQQHRTKRKRMEEWT